VAEVLAVLLCCRVPPHLVPVPARITSAKTCILIFRLAGFADENINPISSTPAGDFGESKWGGDHSGGQFEPTSGADEEGNDSKCRKYVSFSPGKLYKVSAADKAQLWR
jgi:hypothetical protein